MARTYDDPEVNALIRRGEIHRAAERLYTLGKISEALSLFESIFAHDRAGELALELEERPRALGNFLDARDINRALRVREAIATGSTDEILAAAEIYERRRMWADAAELYELAAEPRKAAELWRRHGDLARAARRYEEIGEFRRAGECYEEHLREIPGDPEASLRLGRILLRFRHYDAAITHLQRAAEARELRVPALETLVRAFDASHLGNAAREAYASLRELRPELPPRCEDYLAGLRRSEEERAEEQLLLGRYRMGRLLGSGGMARVYLATDEFSGREVSIKIFAGGNTRQYEAYQRFVREARIVSSLSHPNVVRVFEFHPDKGFLVMEYMAGGTLEDRLRPDLPLRQIPPVVKAISAGLEAAHLRGIIHRDIKPANIFYGAAGEVKLGDFGVAHLQDLGATQTGGFIGTLAYMAPEQVTGARLSAAADQYGLGVTLYRMLTGVLPFDGPDVAAQHLSREPDPPSSRRPGLPAELDAVVLKALAKDPQERFPSITHFRDAFLRIDIQDVRTPSLLLPTPPVRAPRAPQGPRYQEEEAINAPEHLSLTSARDQRLERNVVLERLAPGQEHLKKRWKEGLIALSRAADPSLETLLALEEDFAVWERIEGETLASLIARGPLPATRALEILEELARAVAALHAVGIPHGAIAPENVLVEPSLALLLTQRRLVVNAEAAAEDVHALGLLLVTALGGGVQDNPWAEAAALLASDLTREGERMLQESVAEPPNAAAQVAALARALLGDVRARRRKVAALAWAAAVAAEGRGDGAIRTAQEVIAARAVSWGLSENVAADLLRSAIPVRRG